MDIYRAHVLCCGGTGCTSSGSAQLIQRFEEKIKECGLDKEVKVIRTGCFGLCEAGPVVIVYPEGTFYSRVKVEDVDEIVTEHLLKGRKVQHLVYSDHATHEQNANKALQISDHAYIMQTGEVVRYGTGAELLADDTLSAAYLGN